MKGQKKALKNGKSLLPAGVINVSGNFKRGDTVRVIDENKEEIARGLVAYASDDAEKIVGTKSSEIENILGYGGREELIHRSDMVMSEH